jgi:hypothetical protein
VFSDYTQSLPTYLRLSPGLIPRPYSRSHSPTCLPLSSRTYSSSIPHTSSTLPLPSSPVTRVDLNARKMTRYRTLCMLSLL